MAATYPLLFFTSRTPHDVGQRRCQMERFLAYHAGPHGTGYKRISQSIPLATGSGVHDGMELIGHWLVDWRQAHGNALPAADQLNEVIAWAAESAAAKYQIKAERTGLEQPGVEQLAEAQRFTILEQRTLIEAQVWMLGLVWLPQVLSRYRVLGVEIEEMLILQCSCGLTDAVQDWRAHVARGCTGIAQQGRADYLLEDLTTPNIAYAEFKTKATPNAPWEKAWEYSGQLLVNMEAASRRLDKPVSEAFIVVAFKGWYGRDRNDPPEMNKYQHSPLVQGYFDPGAPPMREQNWAAQYKWWDDYGNGHTLPRTYKKTPIWDPEYPLAAVRPGASRVESWIKTYITESQRAELIKVIGPLPRPVTRVPLALQAIEVEERDWQATVDTIRRNTTTPVEELPIADRYVTRSWQCADYSGAPCAFVPLCYRDPGWEDPMSLGRYEIRTPHHQPEKEMFEDCGVVFPPQDDDEEGEL